MTDRRPRVGTDDQSTRLRERVMWLFWVILVVVVIAILVAVVAWVQARRRRGGVIVAPDPSGPRKGPSR